MLPLRRSLLFLSITTALTACGQEPPVVLLPPSGPPDAWDPQFFALDLSRVGPEDSRTVEHLLADANSVVHTLSFGEHLQRVQSLAVGAGGARMVSGDVVARTVFGAHGPFEVRYETGGETCEASESETADTGVDLSRATTCLQRVVLERAESKVPEELACALNTVVHEWSHAVVADPADGAHREGVESLYQDRGHAGADAPLVSYTLGSIAQCVYLDQRFESHLTDGEFARCLREVGTKAFSASTCHEGWWKDFVADVRRPRAPR